MVFISKIKITCKQHFTTYSNDTVINTILNVQQTKMDKIKPE